MAIPVTSRQRRWQLDRIKAGLCATCGQEPLVSASRCRRCLRKLRLYSRKRKQGQRWHEGEAGRPPIGKGRQE